MDYNGGQVYHQMSYKRVSRLGPGGPNLGAEVKKTYQPGEEGFTLLDRIIDRLSSLQQTVYELSGPVGVPLGQDPTLRAGYDYFLMTSLDGAQYILPLR